MHTSFYFFHSEGSELQIDEEGTDFSTTETARAEAMQTVGEMLRERAFKDQLADGVRWHLWVTDGPGAAGPALISINILIQNGPSQTEQVPERCTDHVLSGEANLT
jgi:hypothetical protein